MKKTSATIFTIALMLTIVSAQTRYSHVPRVKTDANTVKKSNKLTVVSEKPVSTTTASYMIKEENKPTETDIVVNVENTSVASTSEEEVMVNTKSKPIAIGSVKHSKTIKQHKKTDKAAFTKKVKESSRLMDVKDVKKSNISVGLLVMILLFALGTILLALALILYLTSSTFSFTAFLVLLIIGSLMLIAASIMLTLFKFGIIS